MTGYAFRIPTPPRMLSMDEQTALLTVTGERRGAFRDHIILSMALGTGLREHELLALDVGDIADDLGKIRRRVHLKVFKRSAKEPPPQEVLLSETIRTKLSRFLGHRSNLCNNSLHLRGIGAFGHCQLACNLTDGYKRVGSLYGFNGLWWTAGSRASTTSHLPFRP